MVLQNPLSMAAMKREEIGEGVLFTWYRPGEPSSVKRGRFTSEPYTDGRDDSLVDYVLDGEDVRRTTDLCSLGVTCATDGRWANCLTVIREE